MERKEGRKALIKKEEEGADFSEKVEMSRTVASRLLDLRVYNHLQDTRNVFLPAAHAFYCEGDMQG